MSQILSSRSTSVYFDTCLVGAVVTGDHPAQVPALSALLRRHELGGITAVASTEVLGEITAIPERYQGPHMDVCNQLRRLPAGQFQCVDESSTSTSLQLDRDYVALGQILPHDMDCRHLFHAIQNRVQYFATVDYQSILSRAPQIEAAFPIEFGTPEQAVGWLGIPLSTSTG